MNLGRLYRTVRTLKARQIAGRLWMHTRHPKPRLGPAPSLRPRAGSWASPTERIPSLTAPDRARFLNREALIACAGVWNDPVADKLWLYNLHYFDDLIAEGAAHRRTWHETLIGRWIAENPPGYGNGWEPYPVSLRLVNWIKWSLGGAVLEPAWRHSLAVQARWLEQRCEWHLLGNHLWANAKALIFAGLWFDGPEAARWLAKGLRILDRELREQFLADGGHFERSPMYHSILLEDLLDLINIAGAYNFSNPAVSRWRSTVSTMRSWLKAMCHPDGEISFFNDAAFGIASPTASLDAYAGRLGLAKVPATPQGVVDLAESGYARAAMGEAVLLVDMAPLGPDYLLGHAHADTLSFELSLRGYRLIVNSGTSVYGAGLQRQRERATAAHSTVVVDNSDSSEMWSGFRVGRRASILARDVKEASGALILSAGHDGYRVLPGKPVHFRHWNLFASSLTVRDHVRGGAGRCQAHFHLHPQVRACATGGHSGEILLADDTRLFWRSTSPAEVVPSTWYPQFGIALPSQQIVVQFDDDRAEVEFAW